MGSSVRSSDLPYLPAEILALIIGSITDSRYLPRVWLNFRRVSRRFKAETEQVFILKHLPRSRLEFAAFEWVYDYKHQKIELDFSLDFDRVSDDGTRAFYIDKVRQGDHGKHIKLLDETESRHRELVRQWMKKTKAYTAEPPENRYDLPPHIFVLRRIANDTELPGLTIDYKTFEASFLWQQALSKLFGEEEYQKWAEAQQPNREQQIKDLSKNIRNGTLSRFVASREVMTKLHEPKKVESKVRQYRIKRYYKAYGDLDLSKGHFTGDLDYWRKANEVQNLREDLQRTFIGDEWKMGRREEDKGHFYDGAGPNFPTSEPDSEGSESGDREDFSAGMHSHDIGNFLASLLALDSENSPGSPSP